MGADIDVVTVADLDGARVTVRAVDEIARHPETGKLLPIVRL